MKKADTTRTAKIDAIFPPFEADEHKIAPMELDKIARNSHNDVDPDVNMLIVAFT